VRRTVVLSANRRRFSEEFKDGAVRLVLDEGKVATLIGGMAKIG